MDLRTTDRLNPDEAPSKLGQTWDPTVGAFKAQRLPLALSKSSVPAHNTDWTTNGQGLPPASPFFPHRSTVSSPTSFVTNRTVSDTPTSWSSFGSQNSRYSNQTRVRLRAPLQAIVQNWPAEIYECILQQLKTFHEDPRSQSCQTCYMRDLCSLSLTSRGWDKAVVKRLYDRIHIVGHDSKENIKKYKTKVGVRLKLLRRTLRERTFLAQYVHELKVPRLQANGDPPGRDTINLVASLVMACPNLERLVGFYAVYGHEYDRLTHALSTRSKLKEHLWLIGENAAITQRSHRQLAPGLMDPEQKASFVNYHTAWSFLTTLCLHSPSQGILEKDVFVNTKTASQSQDPRKLRGPGILHRLPSLKHLCVSCFDMDDFDDFTLQHLPALHSLRLQDLEGVTFWGLSEYSRTRNAFSLRSLALVNVDITYISAISNLLLHLKNLKRFTLVQDTSPEVAEGEIAIHPIIASNQLEYLHWEIPVPGTANSNLAASIRAKGFPRLRTLRAPCDHDGILQALCKPRAQCELPSDWSSRFLNDLPPNSLRAARGAAQQRIEQAWTKVQFRVIVEENGRAHEIFDFQGFVGTIGSKISYSLEPDVPGSDRALADFEDVMGGKEEVGGKNFCRGGWNANHPGGNKRWQHAERPRYRPVELAKFF